MMLAWIWWAIGRGRQVLTGGAAGGLGLAVVAALAIGTMAWALWSDVKGEIRGGAVAACNAAAEKGRADAAEARERALRAALAERDRTLAVRGDAIERLEAEIRREQDERDTLRRESAARGDGGLVGFDPGWLRGRSRAAAGADRR